jgi:hypothetical protein
MDSTHADFAVLARVRDAIYRRTGGAAGLTTALPLLVRDAIDFVIDPVRTARTTISQLDNVEKTFIGLKVEHYFRDLLDVPKGIRDLVIDGLDVDIKNTVGSSWMIPPETYRTEDPCILIATAKDEGHCRLGLMLARDAYLTRPNRDSKRAVSANGKGNILWLVPDAPFPPSRWTGIAMARFRELRRVRGGTRRAALFFAENLRMPIHRSIVQALLFDQDDYMKRLRGNGGARDLLLGQGIVILSGVYDLPKAQALGLRLASDEMMAVRISDTESPRQ